MRLYGIRFLTMLLAILPRCWAQVSDSCKSAFVTPEVSLAMKNLHDANVKTDENDKHQAIASARMQFAQSLAGATGLAACVGGLGEKEFAGILELRRIDKQVGASRSASGSTNLVPSGSVPALLGLAVEYGGLTEAFSGTTVTFRTTPAKLLAAMANAYGPDATQPNDSTLLTLQRLSVSASFDTSRTSGVSANGTQLQATYAQLSQAAARVILINDRDPLAPKNWKKIRALSVAPPSQNVANAARDLVAPLLDMSGYDDAVNKAMSVFDASATSPNQDALQNAMVAYINDIQQLAAKVPNWQQRVTTYIAARVALDEAHKELYRKISKAPSLSLEYDFNRPPIVSATPILTTSAAAVNPPDLSTVGLVYVASILNSDYTLNATANFFNQTQPSMSGSFRDFQFGGKWDIAVGHLPSFIAKGTLTFSGLYEHLHQKPLGVELLINNQAVNKPGNIGVFQAKYSIPVGDSGFEIPIAFTASNRTELIKEKDVRGHIGITFDLDKLLAKK